MMRRGFSLMELLVVMAILVMLVGLTSIFTHRGRHQAGSQGLAMQVAEELRAARERAISTRTPVAVVFPSASGSVPHSRSLRILEGQTPPKTTRVVDYQGDHPDSCIFVGYWDLAGSTNTITAGRTGTNLEGWPLEGWDNPQTMDYYFVFLPDGSLKTNDLAVFDGHYHLLVASAVSYGGGAPPGTPSLTSPPSYFHLTGAAEPFTLNLTTAGTITVTGGVTGAVPLSPPGACASPAPAATLVQSANQSPAIPGFDISPRLTADFADGQTASVTRDGYITVQIDATDPDGDALRCQFASTALTSTDPGTFSGPTGPTAMVWDFAAGHWRSTWEWHPPVSAAVGDRFTLDCTVTDGRGGSVTASGSGFVVAIEVRDRGHIVISDSNDRVRVFNGDGSSTWVVPLPPGVTQVFQAMASPDGTKVAYNDLSMNLFIMNIDGSGVKQVPVPPPISNPVAVGFTPDGTRIAVNYYNMSVNGDGALIALDGSPPILLPGVGNAFAISPDGTKIAYPPWGMTPVPGMTVANADGTSPVVLPIPFSCSYPVWSPDGQRLLFPGYDPLSSGPALYTVTPFIPGSGDYNLTQKWLIPPGGAFCFPAFSPPGSQIFASGDVIQNYVLDDPGGGLCTSTRVMPVTVQSYWFTTWTP